MIVPVDVICRHENLADERSQTSVRHSDVAISLGHPQSDHYFFFQRLRAGVSFLGWICRGHTEWWLSRALPLQNYSPILISLGAFLCVSLFLFWFTRGLSSWLRHTIYGTSVSRNGDYKTLMNDDRYSIGCKVQYPVVLLNYIQNVSTPQATPFPCQWLSSWHTLVPVGPSPTRSKP